MTKNNFTVAVDAAQDQYEANIVASMTDTQRLDFYKEQAAFGAVANISKILAKAAEPIAHIGDGNCGHVVNVVMDALREAGLYRDLISTPPAYQKRIISQSLRTAVFERDMYRCKHCGTHLDLCIDHIIPEVNGGTDDMDNLQTLCWSCNSKKGVH